VGCSIPCSDHVHAGDAQHRRVEVEAVEHRGVEVACRVFLSPAAPSLWWVCTYSAAPTRKPAVPQAGSQTVSSGVGSTSSTIMRMMWRGRAELAVGARPSDSFESMYS
jgi:hypothetical protein